MAQNNTLGMRSWDLIVVDEAQSLCRQKKARIPTLTKLRALSGHHTGFKIGKYAMRIKPQTNWRSPEQVTDL